MQTKLLPEPTGIFQTDNALSPREKAELIFLIASTC